MVMTYDIHTAAWRRVGAIITSYRPATGRKPISHPPAEAGVARGTVTPSVIVTTIINTTTITLAMRGLGSNSFLDITRC